MRTQSQQNHPSGYRRSNQTARRDWRQNEERQRQYRQSDSNRWQQEPRRFEGESGENGPQGYGRDDYGGERGRTGYNQNQNRPYPEQDESSRWEGEGGSSQQYSNPSPAGSRNWERVGYRDDQNRYQPSRPGGRNSNYGNDFGPENFQSPESGLRNRGRNDYQDFQYEEMDWPQSGSNDLGYDRGPEQDGGRLSHAPYQGQNPRPNQERRPASPRSGNQERDDRIRFENEDDAYEYLDQEQMKGEEKNRDERFARQRREHESEESQTGW